MPAKVETRLCLGCHNQVEELRVKQIDAYTCARCATKGFVVRWCTGCRTLVEQERIKMLDANTCAACAHGNEQKFGTRDIFDAAAKRLRQAEFWRNRQEGDANYIVVPPASTTSTTTSKKHNKKKKLPPVLMTEIFD